MTAVRPPSALDLGPIVAGLRRAREKWRAGAGRTLDSGAREFPSRDKVAAIVDGLMGALFPMRLGPADLKHEHEDYYVGHTLGLALESLRDQVLLELHLAVRPPADEPPVSTDSRAHACIAAFAESLPRVRELVDADVLAAYRGDPAARTVDEVLLCYPGVEAVVHHRLAHQLYRLGLPLLARIVSEKAHAQTGIDIHPGALIGEGFFIDHGTGVVIGETAVIGANVRLYQAVTLGARSFPTDGEGQLKKGLPRHPIVEDDVVIYAGATILGRITIGRGSTIGGNVWLTQSVPPGTHVTQATTQTRRGEGETL